MLSGRTMLSRALQPQNACEPSISTPSSMTTSFSDVHPMKAPEPIVLTVDGIMTFFRVLS